MAQDDEDQPTQPSQQRSSAWWKGFLARREKKPGIPPYGIGTPEASDWANGWVDGAD